MDLNGVEVWASGVSIPEMVRLIVYSQRDAGDVLRRFNSRDGAIDSYFRRHLLA